MKAFVLAIAVFAGAGSLAACDRTNEKTYVTEKKGAVNPALCSGTTPYIIFTKKGAEGQKIVCVSKEKYDSVNVGNVFP